MHLFKSNATGTLGTSYASRTITYPLSISACPEEPEIFPADSGHGSYKLCHSFGLYKRGPYANSIQKYLVLSGYQTHVK